VNTRSWLLSATVLTGLLAVAACSGSSNGSSDLSKQPAPPVHWVVSLGDSYISGEGDRWAGNTNGSFANVDALGTFAYAAPDGLELIPGCHQADLPEVAVNYSDVRGENLACSGAETATKTEGTFFKPGIDFYDKGTRVGQALALERFAKTHDVTAVVLSIGGNDFNFSTILTQCVEDFIATAVGPHTFCSNDPKLASYFTPGYVSDVEQRIGGAISNITTAMQRAGHKPSDYRIIVQNYPSPVPSAGGFRYPQTTAARLDLGGCPVFDKDASWANSTVLGTINSTVKNAVDASGLNNITLLDLSQAFVGHRLCEKGASQLQATGLGSWQSAGAANALEWVNEVYIKGIPWQTQESAHPNYWGTAAERNCLRQVLQGQAASSVSCVRDGTAMVGHEPKMTVTGG
jgi:hypothetical protein